MSTSSGIRNNWHSSWIGALVLVLSGLLECGPARADWSISGAQYACKTGDHLFEILPYNIDSDSPDLPEDVPLTNGFEKVQSEVPIVCVLGTNTLRVIVNVIEPYDGNGMGAGRVDIVSMKIGNIELLSSTEYLGWDSERKESRLIRVRVSGEAGSVSIERCYGEVTLLNNPNIDHCESKKVSIRP